MQHSEEWHALRCGVITASVMKNLLKKKTDKKTGEVTFSIPETDTTKAYYFELASQRVWNSTEDLYQSFDMMRGLKDEVDAFNLYCQNYEHLETCGFITNDDHGVLLGFSPDGLTAQNEDGFIEVKSRNQKFQAETIYSFECPDDFIIQIQTGLIVSGRKWCDFLSYCGGTQMFKIRVYPDLELQKTIISAAVQADAEVNRIATQIRKNLLHGQFILTKKRVEDISA